MSGEPAELATLRDAYPGYRFRRKEIRGVACYLAEAKPDAQADATGEAEAPLVAAQDPAILATMLAAAAGRPVRLRPEAVAAAYRDKSMTVSQCAQTFGVSRTTIVKLLSAHGIAPRRPGDGVDEAAVVAAYRDQRLSLYESAVRFGISQRRVAAVLDRHGVARRPAGRPAQRGG